MDHHHLTGHAGLNRYPRPGGSRPSRRVRGRAFVAGLLAAGVVLGPALDAAAAGPAASSPGAAGVGTADRQAVASLPAPGGPYAIGTTTLRLRDDSRQDPWQPGQTRELMISFWYPAERGNGPADRAAYMTPEAGAHFGGERGAGVFNYHVLPGRTDWSATRTHAREGAPVLRGGGPRPVILYSAGLGDPRTWNTGLVEDLASRGYVVVTVDHPYDASEVQYPDGHLVESVLPELAKQPDLDVNALLRKVMRTRVEDTRFVLDQLGELKAGRAGAAAASTPPSGLPAGLPAALDLGRIGMAGHSAGGFTAAQTMHDDPRIKAGINLDGQLEFPGPDAGGSTLSTVARDGLDRPFLLMGTRSADSGDYHHQPSWQAFWSNSRGWHADVTLTGSQHGSYTDAQALLPQLAAQGAIAADRLTEDIGTVAPQRAVTATRAYVASFFDRWLRGHDDHLLDGPSARYPEMEYAR